MKYLPKTVDFPGLLLSLTGLDTYLISFFDFKFYSLFDWFIGFILILYLIFPLMYSIYKKNQFLLLFTAISLLSFTLYISNNQIDSRFITLRILEFSLGMLYAKTALSKNNGNHFLILMFSLLALFTFYTTSTVIFFFIRLIIVDYIFIETAYFICSHFKKNKIINKSITYLASISYLIFLLQHQVIIRIMGDIFLPNKVFFAPAFISSLLFQSIFIILFIIFFAVMLSKIGKIIFNRFMISK